MLRLLKTSTRLAPLLLLFAGLLPAQYYVTTHSVALSSSAGVWTVQQGASGNPGVRFVAAYISSSTGLTFTLERNGTAATTTTLATTPVNPSESAASNSVAFSASNVGTGTVIGNYQIAANSDKVIDLSKVYFPNVNKSQNLTIRTSSGTGTVTIVILWQETSF